ncbi:MAG: RidA family protein [SAR86 cluster bacterium]|uniref:RidA family protein n=1 Tax=SAR86 cluster bacterium TaxID=2030880 RepID=A0A520MA81_9GAMM|nr:MAG: RidA family protein [SAR86 cluster bacterium]
MTKKIIFTEKAPKAIGPYSQGVVAGNTLYISGQVPLNPETSSLIEGDIASQAKQVISNIENICIEAGASLSDIVKLNIYLTDLLNFSDVNEVMQERFAEPYPARATVEVAGLPLGVEIEMDAIVYLNE